MRLATFYTLYKFTIHRIVITLVLYSSYLYAYSTTLLNDESGRLRLQELRRLPLGPSWLTAAESFYLPVVLTSHDLASFALMDRSYVNVSGSSTRWQKTYFNYSDISHPGEPGKALIDLPFHYIESLQIASVLANSALPEGWHYQTRPSPVDYTAYNYGLVATIGGPALIPAGVLDREPPQLWGAPQERRAFLPSHELDVQLQFKQSRLFAESILHHRDFISTKDAELARRNTLFWEQSFHNSSLTLGLQHLRREQEGVEWGDSQTQASSRLAGLLKWDSNYRGLLWHTALGLGEVKVGRLTQLSHTRAIEDDINHRPSQLPLKQLAWFWDNRLSLALPSPLAIADMMPASLHWRLEAVAETLPKVGYSQARTYLGHGLDVFTLTGGNAFQRYSLNGRYTTGFTKDEDDYSWQFEIGIAGDILSSRDEVVLTRLAPIALLKGSLFRQRRQGEFFAGLRHEIIPLTHQEAWWLAGKTSWQRNYWYDHNQDGYYQIGEAGALLPRTGSAYTRAASNLRTPFFEELALGYRQYFLQSWQLVVRSLLRYYSYLYQLRMAGHTTYETLAREDMEGGQVYSRTDGNIGQEFYELTNKQKNSFYTALELQLLRLRQSNSWFFNAAAGAYLHLAHPPPGNDIWHNDIGVVSDTTADPNGRLNLYGRTDYDRGYMVKLITGFLPFKDFSWVNAVHYRDGIPVGKVKLVDGIAQGPVVAQHSKRANAEKGIGRFVFYMQWDMRFSYEFKDNNYVWFMALDIYNVNGFSLELKERFFADHNYRDPVESMAPRTIRVVTGAKF